MNTSTSEITTPTLFEITVPFISIVGATFVAVFTIAFLTLPFYLTH